MDTTTQIPAEIEAIIERKKAALLEERQQEADEKQRQLAEAIEKGRAEYDEYIKLCLLQAPEWIRPYFDAELAQPDYERIGKGWDRLDSISLYFSIPGLANIEFNPQKNNWRAESAGWRGDGSSTPYIHFNNNSYWRSDIEYVLGEAKRARDEYETLMKEYRAKQDEMVQRQEAYILEERENEAYRLEAEAREKFEEEQKLAEEQVLLDVLKNDPIAMSMLKAFVTIHQERTYFTTQIEDANNSLYSMEEYWSSKAASLRRQAEDAQRHAEEEKYRLQNDLDDAEAKLKKAQKEQRGW